MRANTGKPIPFDAARIPWQTRRMSGTSADLGPAAAPQSPTFSPATEPLGPGPGGIGFLRGLVATTIGTVFVILFGAVVRITGSGAGCGQHWPTCQGEIAHLPKTLETLIEYTHRITSGIAGLAVFGLLVWTFRIFPAGHPVRLWISLSAFFMAVEALVGMLLVRLSLVGTDASLARAVIMPLHLTNTLLLLAALASSIFFCWPRDERAEANVRAAGAVGFALLGVLLVSATGALTALGDTVYPARADHTLAQLASDHSQAAHFLERARAIHPVLAIGLLGAMASVLPGIAKRGSFSARQLARISLWAVAGQGLVGVVNILMSAPGSLQVLHLAVTCTIWILLVLLGAELWRPRLASTRYGRASGSSLEAAPMSARTIR